jgi:RCD1-SRO-TAF4 (RST) domain-containing protein
VDDSLEDMVSRFLLGERKLLEKEIEGEPTAGHREPTPDRFALVDQLYQEHRRSPMSKDQFEQRLRQTAGAAGSEQRDQAAQMLDRWDQFHLMGQPVAQRNPYDPSE